MASKCCVISSYASGKCLNLVLGVSLNDKLLKFGINSPRVKQMLPLNRQRNLAEESLMDGQ